MPLEPPDQQYWQAAVGYVELGMFQDANDQLEKIDPFNRAVPEVLPVRIAIYHGLKQWELMREIAKRLADAGCKLAVWRQPISKASEAISAKAVGKSQFR